MPAKKRIKLIFEYSDVELNARLRETLAKVLEKRAALNLSIVYRNSLCRQPNQFIHEYPDGRKLLIQQDSKNSEEIILLEI